MFVLKLSFFSMLKNFVAYPVVKTPIEQLWHQRLGHASSETRSHLNFGLNFDCKPCDSCHKAKQQRYPFIRVIFSQCVLLNLSIWTSPYKRPSSNRSTYFQTIVEDFSRSTWIYLLPNKTRVANVITNFVAIAKSQYNSNIRSIKTNNGTEFLNSQCQTIFQTNGISH